MYPRWAWWWFRDKKWIVGSELNVNIAYGFLAWGRFQIYTSPNDQCEVLDYSIGRFPWKYIKDRVWKLADGILVGEFRFLNLPLAEFTMEKEFRDG